MHGETQGAGCEASAVRARPCGTKTGRARGVVGLLGRRYAGCEKVRPALDDPNTHTEEASYAAFEPERARDLVRRIEFCYSAKHRSWLNVAECELSAMPHQCPSGCRIGDLSELRTQQLAA